MTGGTTSMDVTSEAAEKAADDDGNPAGIEGKARLESCLGCYCCCLRCCCCYSFPSPPCETLVHGPAARRKRRAHRACPPRTQWYPPRPWVSPAPLTTSIPHCLSKAIPHPTTQCFVAVAARVCPAPAGYY